MKRVPDKKNGKYTQRFRAYIFEEYEIT